MPHMPEEIRTSLLAEAARAGERQRHHQDGLEHFLERYYRHVADDDLRARDAVDLLGAALSHRQNAAVRPPGTANVRVFTPTVDEHGWSTGAHRRRDRHRRHALPRRLRHRRAVPPGPRHPPASCTRSSCAPRRRRPAARGARRRRPPSRPGRTPDRPDDARVESWMHLEIDRETDGRGPRRRSTAGCGRCSRDVRVAVEDWPRMRERRPARRAERARATPPAGAGRRGGRGGRAAAALARRRPLHLPRLPGVRA